MGKSGMEIGCLSLYGPLNLKSNGPYISIFLGFACCLSLETSRRSPHENQILTPLEIHSYSSIPPELAKYSKLFKIQPAHTSLNLTFRFQSWTNRLMHGFEMKTSCFYEPTHRNPSFSWSTAPMMLSPKLAIWEARTHITASCVLTCFTKTKNKSLSNLKFFRL